MTRYSVFNTYFGWMGVVKGEKGLKRIILPHPEQKEVEKIIFREFPGAIEGSASLKPLTKSLRGYFTAKRSPQNFSLDWSGYSIFFVSVWRTAQTIPWGEVRTYKWLSAQLKNPRASRAAGNALGKNPLPIVVPCHRIVRSDGALGGFSAPGGISLKRKLLALEGIQFDKRGKVIFDR